MNDTFNKVIQVKYYIKDDNIVEDSLNFEQNFNTFKQKVCQTFNINKNTLEQLDFFVINEEKERTLISNNDDYLALTQLTEFLIKIEIKKKENYSNSKNEETLLELVNDMKQPNFGNIENIPNVNNNFLENSQFLIKKTESKEFNNYYILNSINDNINKQFDNMNKKINEKFDKINFNNIIENNNSKLIKLINEKIKKQMENLENKFKDIANNMVENKFKNFNDKFNFIQNIDEKFSYINNNIENVKNEINNNLETKIKSLIEIIQQKEENEISDIRIKKNNNNHYKYNSDFQNNFYKKNNNNYNQNFNRNKNNHQNLKKYIIDDNREKKKFSNTQISIDNNNLPNENEDEKEIVNENNSENDSVNENDSKNNSNVNSKNNLKDKNKITKKKKNIEEKKIINIKNKNNYNIFEDLNFSVKFGNNTIELNKKKASQYTKKITLENDGNVDWPKNCALFCVKNLEQNGFYFKETEINNGKSLKKGEKINVEVKIKPQKNFDDKNDLYCIDCDIKVKNEKSLIKDVNKIGKIYLYINN